VPLAPFTAPSSSSHHAPVAILLRPYNTHCVRDGAPVSVGGLEILCTQLVNVGRGTRRVEISRSDVIASLRAIF
jgi:hypothetical protein